MPKALSKETVDLIVRLYKENTSIIRIAEIIGKPYPTITKILEKNIGYSNKRPSQGNINYFDTIDTHNKAYILGYIAADGNMYIDKRKNILRLTLVCNTKDKQILEFIKSEIKCETKILDSRPLDKRTGNLHERSSLSLGNQTLCKALTNLGIYPNKTFTLGNIITKLPKEFRRSFILGYFDGDGHVAARIDKRVSNPNYRTYTISICGTPVFLQGIADELRLKRYKITNFKNYSNLTICNKQDFYTFYTCYKNISFCLERKHKIFLQRVNYE